MGERFGGEQQGQTLTPFLEGTQRCSALLMVTVPVDTRARSSPWHAKPLASGHISTPHPDSGLWEQKVSKHHSLPAWRVSQREETLIKWIWGGSCDVPVLNLGVALYHLLGERSSSQDCSKIMIQQWPKARSCRALGFPTAELGKKHLPDPNLHLSPLFRVKTVIF